MPPQRSAESHGGIEVAAGDATGSGDHDGDGQAVGQRDTEQIHVVLVTGVNGANADEDEGERADGFRDAF